MSSICGNAFNALAWPDSPEVAYLDHPSPLCGSDPTFSASDSASDSHLHDVNGSSVANHSLGLPGLQPPFKDLSKEQLSFFESNNVGEPVQSNEDTFVEIREERPKRTRSQNWSHQENRAFLELKVEALQEVEGKDWDYISQGLRDRYKFDRSSKVCEYHWSTLLKADRAIRKHESSKSQTSNWVSYWDMDDHERSGKKLHPSFLLEWYKMMERILAGKKKRPRPTGHGEDQTSNRKYSSTEGSGATLEENGQLLESLAPLIKHQVEDGVNSELESLKTSDVTSEQDKILRTMAPLVKHQVEAAVIYALRLLALTGFIVDEDDPITMLAPHVRKYIKDALNSALQPVASALQALAQEEQEDRARLRAIEEQKRALDLEEMKIKGKRHHIGRHQRAPKSSKRQVPPGKNYSSAEEIVPALKGWRIAGDQGQINLLEDECPVAMIARV